MSDVLPKAASVYLDHDAGISEAVPAAADVYLVDDIAPPVYQRHMLFVICDDMPPTSLFTSINTIAQSPAPGPPYSATTGLLAQTPTLQSLAAQGVRFECARVMVKCSPTRAQVLTGVYGFRSGIANVVNANASQAGDLMEFGDPGFVWPTLFNSLSQAGVRTAFVGKIHLSADYNQTYNGQDGSGWAILDRIVAGDTYTATTLRNLNQTSGDLILNADITSGNAGYYRYALNLTRANQSETLQTEFNTTRLTNLASAWWQTVDNSERAFMWLAYNAVHTPLGFTWSSGKPNGPAQDFPPDALVNTQEWKDIRDAELAEQELHSYYEDQQAHAEAIDTELGRLLSEIPQDVRARLTVVFIGDNGHDSIALPNSRTLATWSTFANKDFGTDWNYVLDNVKLKGTLYRYGSGVECLISGPGPSSFSMSGKGTLRYLPVDGPDITEFICEYFGTSMSVSDGISFYNALYIDTNADHLTHTRDQQYSETFNPNGDYNDLMSGPAAGQQLEQSMWAWLKSANGFSPAGRFSLIRKRVSGAWTYELYHHLLEDLTRVDYFERTNLASDSAYATHKADLEARIEALLASDLGDGGAAAIEVVLPDLSTKFLHTVAVDGDESIPVTMDDGVTVKYIPSGTSTIGGTLGMPADNTTGRVVPYVGTGTTADWQLRVDISTPTLGPFDKFIPLDASDALPVDNAGGRVIPSVPGSPNHIAVDNAGGAVLLLEST